MNIYRHKNGYLYTLSRSTPRGWLKNQLEATPYNHAIPVYARRKWVEMKDFTLVATGATLPPRWSRNDHCG